ncbi:enoyl-CoA delta isomerase 2-like [Centruroides vittatus]|uniref:enoyl-CoA delta isomerase 2-like n=1 Tax=Centruroides vittatus TaxID=120091 RepID=UPI00350FF131
MVAYVLRHVLGKGNVIWSKQMMRKPPLPSVLTFLNKNKQYYSSATERFEEAKLKLKTISKEPSDDIKLKLYALFKQSTIGPCKTNRPSVLDSVGRAKWDAWNSLGSMNQDDAKQQYADLINELSNTEQPTKMTDTTAVNNSEMKDINVIKEDNVTKIILNRPKKKNALTVQMYEDFINILDNAGKDDSVIAVITGNGDYYCSGNDLNNFTKSFDEDIVSVANTAKERLKRFVDAFIDFPKPLIAAVNGPAVGISVTLLGLCDVVYAADNATFHTPFSQLAQCPEACSSVIFPKIMGYAKASEMLLFNKKLNAKEALDRGLISEIISKENFKTEIDTRVKQMSQLPKDSLLYSKHLIRGHDREMLHKVNERECEILCERWLSPDFPKVIMAFFQRKSAL